MADKIKAIFLMVAGLAALITVANYFFGDFISARGGVYLSEDKGENWAKFGKAQNTNLGRVNISKIKYNPKDERIIYAGTLGSGALKSVDGGATWLSLGGKTKALSARASVYDIAIDYTLPDYKKNIPDRFYAAAFQAKFGRIFKTEDGGATFKEVYTATRPNYAVLAIELDPRRPNIVWAGTGEGLLMKSQDYGETWKLAQEFKGIINGIVINPANPSQILVSTSRNGVFTSWDGGATWVDESEGLSKYPKAKRIEMVARDPYTGQIYLGTWYGLLKSADGGVSWQPVELVFPSDALPVLAMAFTGKNSREIYVSAKNYVFSTKDGGDFWKVRQLGAAKAVKSLVVDIKNSSRIMAGLGK